MVLFLYKHKHNGDFQICISVPLRVGILLMVSQNPIIIAFSERAEKDLSDALKSFP